MFWASQQSQRIFKFLADNIDALSHDHESKIFEIAVSLTNDNEGVAELYARYGSLLNDRMRFYEASALYEHYFKNSDHGSAPIYRNHALALYKLEKYEEAEQQMQNAIDLSPRYSQYQYEMSIILEQMGRHDEALNYIEKSLRSDQPELTFVFSQNANLLRKLGSPLKAATLCASAIRLDRKFYDAYLNMGDSLVDLGQFHQAKEYFEFALHIAEQNDNPEQIERTQDALYDLAEIVRNMSLPSLDA